MAYILDEEKVRQDLRKALNNAKFLLQGKEIIVSKTRLENASFSKESDLNYQVSGLIRISIKKENDEYEDIYHYSTIIKVNTNDEIENCGNILLYKFNNRL